MGNINKCVKANPHQDDLGYMRDDKARREYYLNMNNEVGQTNYDITEKKRVGYGHI